MYLKWKIDIYSIFQSIWKQKIFFKTGKIFQLLIPKDNEKAKKEKEITQEKAKNIYINKALMKEKEVS